MAVVAGLVLPAAVAAGLAPLRSVVANTDAALVLVAVVVSVAANGHRAAGVLSAFSAAVWFDFFFTRPYEHFSIANRTDIETTILLVAVGAAVTELAVRGRRHRLIAETDAAYLDSIASTVDLANSPAPPITMVTHVSEQLIALMKLRACRFEVGRFGGLVRLEPDGRIRTPDGEWDIDQFGFPNTDVELLATSDGVPYGRFVLTPTPGLVPSLVARRISWILAAQFAAAPTGRRSVARTG